MSARSEIRRAIEAIPDESLRVLSLRLLDRLSEHTGDRSAEWTYEGLARLVGTQADDATLHRCIEVLSSRPSAKVLDMHFLYFDPEAEDPHGEVISDEAVAQAFTEGFLVDPQTGREVYEFMSVLSPYFQISRGVE